MRSKDSALCIIFTVIICIILLALNSLFYYFVRDLDLNIIRLIMFLVLIITIVVNICVYTKNEKKYKEQTGESYYNFLLKKKEEATQDDIQDKIIKQIKYAYYYTLFIIILIIINTFLFFNQNTIIVEIMLYILIIISLGMYFSRSRIINDAHNNTFLLLKKDADKELYDFVYNVAKELNFNANIEIELYFCSDNISIRKENNKIVISLGENILFILNKEELKSVLIHEFAHHINKDTLTNEKYWKYFKLLDRLQSLKVLYNPLFDKVYLETQILKILSSKKIEYKADQEVLKYNEAQNLVNALGKIRIFSYFYNFALIDGSFFAKDEKAVDNHNMMYTDFLKYYNEHKIFLETNIVKELTRRFDTHYSLKDRMKELNITNVYIKFEEPIFQNVINEVIDYGMNSEIFLNDYNNAHKFYVKNTKIIDDDKNIEKLSIEKRINIFEHCMSVNEFKKAFEIVSSILESNPNCIQALYFRGMINITLNNNLDGLNDLEKVIYSNKTNNFIIDAFSLYGEMYNFIGDEEKVEQIKKDQIELYNKDLDLRKASIIKKYNELEKVTDIDIINRIKNYLEEFKEIKQIGLGVKRVRKAEVYYLILIIDINANIDELNNKITIKTVNDELLFSIRFYFENKQSKRIIKNIKI